MPGEDHASGGTLLQKYPLRWLVFALMWISGMMTIVMGVTTQETGWDWKYLSTYLAWIIAMATFVFLDMKPTMTFVVHKFLYLASISMVFWFFCTVLKFNPDTIPIYIPMCTNLGIFLGFGVDHLWSSSQTNIRKMIRIVRDSIALALARSAERQTEEELPLYTTGGLDYVQPHPLPSDGDDRPPPPPPPPRGFLQTL